MDRSTPSLLKLRATPRSLWVLRWHNELDRLEEYAATLGQHSFRYLDRGALAMGGGLAALLFLAMS